MTGNDKLKFDPFLVLQLGEDLGDIWWTLGRVQFRASKEGYPKAHKDFTITEKAFSWLILIRHYAKQALTHVK